MARHTRTQLLATWLCALGLLCLLLGYRGYRYLPMTDAEAQHEELLQKLKLPAARQAVRETEGEALKNAQMFLEELERATVRSRRQPPYYWPGIIAMALGGVLFPLGFWLWLRSTPRSDRWVRSNEDA